MILYIRTGTYSGVGGNFRKIITEMCAYYVCRYLRETFILFSHFEIRIVAPIYFNANHPKSSAINKRNYKNKNKIRHCPLKSRFTLNNLLGKLNGIFYYKMYSTPHVNTDRRKKLKRHGPAVTLEFTYIIMDIYRYVCRRTVCPEIVFF